MVLGVVGFKEQVLDQIETHARIRFFFAGVKGLLRLCFDYEFLVCYLELKGKIRVERELGLLNWNFAIFLELFICLHVKFYF
jgi:hypothetical protein